MVSDESDLVILRDVPKGNPAIIGQKAMAYCTIPVTVDDVSKAKATLKEVFEFWSSRLSTESMDIVWTALSLRYGDQTSGLDSTTPSLSLIDGSPSDIHEPSSGYDGLKDPPPPPKFPIAWFLGGLGAAVGIYGLFRLNSSSRRRKPLKRDFTFRKKDAVDVEYVVVPISEVGRRA